jgi:hypothetical protein
MADDQVRLEESSMSQMTAQVNPSGNGVYDLDDCFKLQPADASPSNPCWKSVNDSSDSSYSAVRKLQQTFNRLPSLREQIAHPQTEEHRRLAAQFSSTASTVLGSYICDYYLNDLLRTGHISLGRVLKMHSIDCFCDPSADYADLFNDLMDISTEDKNLLRTNRNYFLRLFGFMDSRNQQAVLRAVADQPDRAEQADGLAS